MKLYLKSSEKQNSKENFDLNAEVHVRVLQGCHMHPISVFQSVLRLIDLLIEKRMFFHIVSVTFTKTSIIKYTGKELTNEYRFAYAATYIQRITILSKN
jgi:hypothetical protein